MIEVKPGNIHPDHLIKKNPGDKVVGEDKSQCEGCSPKCLIKIMGLSQQNIHQESRRNLYIRSGSKPNYLPRTYGEQNSGTPSKPRKGIFDRHIHMSHCQICGSYAGGGKSWACILLFDSILLLAHPKFIKSNPGGSISRWNPTGGFHEALSQGRLKPLCTDLVWTEIFDSICALGSSLFSACQSSSEFVWPFPW